MDWIDWERTGRAQASLSGSGFATRHARDFALLASLRLRHHRPPIEWARIEPDPRVHDERAVAHYWDVLTATRDAGIVPWVCLHHFILQLPGRDRIERADVAGSFDLIGFSHCATIGALARFDRLAARPRRRDGSVLRAVRD